MSPVPADRVVLRAEGDHYLDPWLTPQTDAMAEIVSEAIAQVQSYERYYGLRKRARRPAAQQVFEAAATALLCAATVHFLTGASGRLKTTRSNRLLSRSDRYKTPLHTRPLPCLLDALASPEIPWLDQQQGVQTGFSDAPTTTVVAGSRLIQRIRERGIQREDIIRGEGGELIELRATKGSDAKLVDYVDTEQTNAWRRQMEAINRYLRGAHLSLEDVTGVDVLNRQLRRVFNNGSFEQGGRLYGGFWQPMSKEERFRYLRIDGKPAVELDYGQMAGSILYGRCGSELPEGDLYAVPGFDYPRKGLKRVFNALLYAASPLRTWPKDTIDMFRDPETGEAPKWKEVRSAVLDRHDVIAPFMETGAGLELMRTESDILLGVLERLMAQGVTALPIHDAILVAEGCEGQARAAMEASFLEHTGNRAKVTISHSSVYDF